MKPYSLFIPALAAVLHCAGPSALAQTPSSPEKPAAANNAGTLLTRVFIVPPDFLTRAMPVAYAAKKTNPPANSTSQTPPADPFAEEPKKAPKDTRSPAQKALEAMGVTFAAPGSSVSYDKGSSRLAIRNTLAQLDLVEAIIVSMTTSGAREGIAQFEIISLPLLAARKAIVTHPVESDLYQWLDAALEKNENGVVLEHVCTLRMRGGQRSKVEAIDEYATPTEVDPPQIPQTVSLIPRAATPVPVPGDGRHFASWPSTSTTPSAFAFRNLGFTLEAEFTFSEDWRTVDLNIAPELVKVISRVPVGLTGEVSLPVFATQKASVQVHAWVGQPALVSTLSPATDTGIAGENKENRVWLLFVTATRPQ